VFVPVVDLMVGSIQGEWIMDVNETLKDIRALLKSFQAVDTEWEEATLATALIEKFESLDEWLSKGGFLPREWESSVTTTRALMTTRVV
jgi:hypothetical protein